jgi:hypothetical protein
LEAKQAVSFFIQLLYFRDDAIVESLTLENGQTQEKLVLRGANEFYDPVVSISRFPIKTNVDEWIKEMGQHPNFDNRIIQFGPDPE